MSLIEEALQASGGPYWNGGQVAPIGSYWNPRTNAIAQNAADGALPLDGRWIQVTNSGTSTLAQCATAINTLVAGLNYTSASLHAQGAGDLAYSQGQATLDG